MDCPDNALAVDYGLERQVVHPIAVAICKLAQNGNISPAEINSFSPGFSKNRG